MKSSGGNDGVHDRLDSYGVYLLARQLFDEFWEDSEMLARDFRGQELARQQVCSLDSVCANIEEGYGRGYGKELPQHLKISRGEARESKGRYQRCSRLLPSVIQARTATLDRIIGGLTKTIVTIGNRRTVQDARLASRHPSPVTRHPSRFQ
ncbi:MAG TPA: four helix bundle protein [Verrucomicrobiae bacterium]|nr:four helix bundle protein [Verrucomicrobiae bacterium]